MVIEAGTGSLANCGTWVTISSNSFPGFTVLSSALNEGSRHSGAERVTGSSVLLTMRAILISLVPVTGVFVGSGRVRRVQRWSTWDCVRFNALSVVIQILY
jgi:hypothetical protein